ncbi:hypothetical protein P8Q88_08200 [Qipengyuania sp. XHP0207]|uniref:hypothetical protein n=1 Tax=Qipengyuania sp. XHP0207 TaxID=3038078 RepID=UPI00241F0ED9|nr:hypothetical protein [Qipengyuania sp. XHP0207]MDG5748161.1 hypothetical protein [Qipengyuania sp. XHP0207]
MSAKDEKTTREDRLAAKLRENLRRRKAQGRELGGKPGHEIRDSGEDGLSKDGPDR